MFPFDYIDPVFFIAALAIGLLYTYLTAPKPTIVIKYPTPDNAGKITYRDDADVCYRYKVVQADCPADHALIKTVPIQI